VQVISFVGAALYSGFWFWRWGRLGVRYRVWPLLGWFSGLICAGSVSGAVAWGSQMTSNALNYEAGAPGVTRRQYYSLFASSNRWYAAFSMSYGLEFLCLIIPKLILLGRLTDNAVRGLRMHANATHKFLGSRVLPMLHRSISALVVVCSFAGLIAFSAASVFEAQKAQLRDQAAAACDSEGHDTNSSVALFDASSVIVPKAATAQAVQNFSEAIALLLISVTYGLLMPLCVAMYRQAEQLAARAVVNAQARTDGEQHGFRTLRAASAVAIVDDAMQAAMDQRRRLIISCVVVLITFPARAAFDFLNAYSSFDLKYNPACGLCEMCQSDQFFVNIWLNYTPEFQPIVVALSSPLPLTVSLWIITAADRRALEISTNVLRARLGRDVQMQ